MPFVGQRVALTLITVVVCMQNPVDGGDPQVAQMIKNATAAEVDQDRMRSVFHHIHVAGILKPVQMFGDFLYHGHPPNTDVLGMMGL